MKKILKNLIIIVLILNVLFLSSPQVLFGQETEVENAVAFLKSQQVDSWITMALVAANENNLDLNYLKNPSGSQATDYEKMILALTAAGKDPRTFGNIDFVTQLKGFYQSNQIGSPDLLNDDFWGILALISAGENIFDPIIQNSKNFILAHQNSDGGWSYAISGQSDTNDTAVAIMALLETGTQPGDPIINKAIDYLKLNQNNDGGFSYTSGNESDSGSDSWIISAIYKLGQNPLNWQKNGQNPIGHLKSLQRSDGSFKWVASEDKGYPILTAYAVIALTENSYPIYRLYNLRIEGEHSNICDANVKAKTALDIVENGAEICNYTYFIEESGFGPYLKKVNNEEAHDLIGWLYFVNYEMPMIGAADYILKPNDQVLWYFGEWGWKPAKLTLASQKINPEENLEAQVKYFENSEWKPLTDATVYIDNQIFITDNDGKVNLIIHTPGVYKVYAEKSGHVRTNQVKLIVGESVESQDVGLKVEIVPGQPPLSPPPDIAFTIDKNQIDFGRLSPGAQANDQLLITNASSSNNDIYIEGIVNGDQVFKDNITLDGLNWQNFNAVFNPGVAKNVLVGLNIPSNWSSFGIKEGSLTIWAINN